MKKLYSQHFPTPSYLSMRSFSFDISEEYIRYGELARTPVGLALERFGEQKIPSGVIVGTEIKDEEKLTNLLKNICLHENIYFARIALPDNSDATIKQYLKIFKNAGFVPLSLELSAQALTRAVIPYDDLRPVLMIDFGEGAITFSIVVDKQVIFTTDLVVSDISEIGKVIDKQYIQWKKEFGNTVKGQINRILLCGKYANMTGLREYITAHMKMKAEYANVWVNISDMKIAVPNIPFEESLAYGKVIGLALGEYVSSRKGKTNLLPQSEKKIINREYKFRLINMGVHMLSIIGVLAIVLILPAYFMSSTRLQIAEQQLENFNSANTELMTHDITNTINDINTKLTLLNNATSAPSSEAVFSLLLSNKTAGITFSHILWKVADDNSTSVEVEGKAKDSSTFSHFKSILDKNSMITITDASTINNKNGSIINFVIQMTVK